MQLQKAKQLIDAHAVISFDIFDTLLVRPYLRPADLFVHLEKLHALPGFAQRRRAAEKQARRHQAPAQDVTLDEIYAELSGQDVCLKEHELALERQVLQPYLPIKQVFDYAKAQGKKIIITSDMYLPAEFLEQVLKEKGFDGFSKLYVSNGPRKTKSTGSLFQHIAQELHLAPHTILHFGDNVHSDVRRAKKAGWHAFLVPTLIEQYFKNHRRSRTFWKRFPGFESSVTLGILAIQSLCTENSYFQQLGYEIGGPTAYGFMRWLESTALKNQTYNILFAARDGYTLQQVFDSFKSPRIHTAYVYALRSLNRLYFMDYNPRSRAQLLSVIHYFTQRSEELAKALPETELSTEQLHQFITQHAVLIQSIADKNKADYVNYLLSLCSHPGPVAIVDSITHFFSAQKLIEACLGKQRVTGYYWSIVQSDLSSQYRFEHFLPVAGSHDCSASFTYRWNFMEFLFTAPHPPIQEITSDGQPLYAPDTPQEELTRIAAYQKVSAGMVDFAVDTKRILNGKDIFLTAEFLIQWVNWFLLHPTPQDQQEMATIFHASDLKHIQFEPLLSYRPTLGQICKNPKKYKLFIKQAYWRTALQQVAVCLLSPVCIEKLSPREINFCLFPRLCKPYARLRIPLGKKRFLSFTYGRRGL